LAEIIATSKSNLAIVENTAVPQYFFKAGKRW